MIEQSSPSLCNSDYKGRINFDVSKTVAILGMLNLDPYNYRSVRCYKATLVVFIDFYNLMEGYDTLKKLKSISIRLSPN